MTRDGRGGGSTARARQVQNRYSCGVEVRVEDDLVRNITVRAVTTITKATVTIYLNNVGGMVMVVQ